MGRILRVKSKEKGRWCVDPRASLEDQSRNLTLSVLCSAGPPSGKVSCSKRQSPLSLVLEYTKTHASARTILHRWAWRDRKRLLAPVQSQFSLLTGSNRRDSSSLCRCCVGAVESEPSISLLAHHSHTPRDSSRRQRAL